MQPLDFPLPAMANNPAIKPFSPMPNTPMLHTKMSLSCSGTQHQGWSVHRRKEQLHTNQAGTEHEQTVWEWYRSKTTDCKQERQQGRKSSYLPPQNFSKMSATKKKGKWTRHVVFSKRMEHKIHFDRAEIKVMTHKCNKNNELHPLVQFLYTPPCQDICPALL